MPRAQEPLLRLCRGQVYSTRPTLARGPRLTQPGGPRLEGSRPDTCWVSQGKPGGAGVSTPRRHPQGILPSSCPCQLPGALPPGKTALGIGILDATLLLRLTTWALPGKTLPLQQEGGSKEAKPGSWASVRRRSLCGAVKVGLPRLHLYKPARACARVALVPSACTRGACVHVCICVGAASADGLTKLLEPI